MDAENAAAICSARSEELRLAFLDPGQFVALAVAHGREATVHRILVDDPRRNRIAVLHDSAGRTLCCGFVSGHALDHRRTDSRLPLRIPWEGDLDLCLDDCEIYLWSFWTPSDLRGNGYYRALLEALLAGFVHKPGAVATIYCRSDNDASLRGIRNAGFRHFDHLEMFRFGPLRFLYSRLRGGKWYMSPTNPVRLLKSDFANTGTGCCESPAPGRVEVVAKKEAAEAASKSC